MSVLSRFWDRTLFAPSSGVGLAAFRIAFALFMLGYLGAMTPHVPLLFSSHGVYVPYLVPDLAPPPLGAWLLYLAMLGATVSLLVGYRTTLSAWCLCLLFAHHYFLQLAIKQSSFDRLIGIYLLILCFAGAGSTWSLDARAGRARPTSVWAERMIMFQTVALYFGAGFWKAVNPHWHGGEMMWFTLQGMFATDVGFTIVRLGLPAWVWDAATIGIIVAEILLGLAFLFRRLRPSAIVAGTFFHLANCVILNIPEFIISITPYAVFMRDETLQRWQARVAALFSRAPDAPPAASP